MLHLNIQGLRDESGWQAAHIALPRYDVSAMQERTLRHPVWIHFGAGNIFRAFLAAAQQTLLNAGCTDTGIVAAASHNFSAATEGYTLRQPLPSGADARRRLLRPGGHRQRGRLSESRLAG